MLLQNNNIILRALEPEDLDILYKWENNSELWIHGNTLSPYSRLALRQYITEAQQQDIYQAKQLRLMIELKSDRTIVGTIDLYDFDFHNSRVGIGILIDTPYRGKGYGLQVLALIKEYVLSFLHVKQLYAYIATDNETSISLFQKSGYTQSGKLTDWICCNSVYKDVLIYQLIDHSHS